MMTRKCLNKEFKTLKELSAYLIENEGLESVQFAIASRDKKRIVCNIMDSNWWVELTPLSHRVREVWKMEA